VLTAVVMKSSVIWDVMLYNPLKVSWHFRGTYCLHLTSLWFLAWLIFRSWGSRLYVPPKRQLTFNGLHGIISQKIELLVVVLPDDCLPVLCEVQTCEQVLLLCMPDNLDHFCRQLISASRAFPVVGSFFFGSASKSKLMSGFYGRCGNSSHPYFPVRSTTVPTLCGLTYLMQYEHTNCKHVGYFGMKFWSERETIEMFALWDISSPTMQ
jgi:hypothetical protein